MVIGLLVIYFSFSGTQCFGFHTEAPTQLKEFEHFPNGIMRPLADTVRPLLWSSSPKRRMGHVMCEFELGEGVSESCTRATAQRQVDRLSDMGWRIKTAFECEFYVRR